LLELNVQLIPQKEGQVMSELAVVMTRQLAMVVASGLVVVVVVMHVDVEMKPTARDPTSQRPGRQYVSTGL